MGAGTSRATVEAGGGTSSLFTSTGEVGIPSPLLSGAESGVSPPCVHLTAHASSSSLSGVSGLGAGSAGAQIGGGTGLSDMSFGRSPSFVVRFESRAESRAVVASEVADALRGSASPESAGDSVEGPADGSLSSVAASFVLGEASTWDPRMAGVETSYSCGGSLVQDKPVMSAEACCWSCARLARA